MARIVEEARKLSKTALGGIFENLVLENHICVNGIVAPKKSRKTVQRLFFDTQKEVTLFKKLHQNLFIMEDSFAALCLHLKQMQAFSDEKIKLKFKMVNR